jgi:nicotinate-nucleotide--dimethylbenzimidazole phosphoribosyltransferase
MDSAREIRNRTFSVGAQGYDEADVEAFLRDLAMRVDSADCDWALEARRLAEPKFRPVALGYWRPEVDAYLMDLRKSMEERAEQAERERAAVAGEADAAAPPAPAGTRRRGLRSLFRGPAKAPQPVEAVVQVEDPFAPAGAVPAAEPAYEEAPAVEMPVTVAVAEAEPVVAPGPVVEAEPVVDAEPVVAAEPVVEVTAAAASETVAVVDDPVVPEPAVLETAAVAEPSAAPEARAVTDAPAAPDAPAVMEEPAVVAEPAAEVEPEPMPEEAPVPVPADGQGEERARLFGMAIALGVEDAVSMTPSELAAAIGRARRESAVSGKAEAASEPSEPEVETPIRASRHDLLEALERARAAVTAFERMLANEIEELAGPPAADPAPAAEPVSEPAAVGAPAPAHTPADAPGHAALPAGADVVRAGAPGPAPDGLSAWTRDIRRILRERTGEYRGR